MYLMRPGDLETALFHLHQFRAVDYQVTGRCWWDSPLPSESSLAYARGDGRMSDLVDRLTRDLEPVLAADDPRPRISAYHNMPYTLSRYDPANEFELRRQVTMLQTRLEQSGERVLRISLAACLTEAMTSVQPLEDWFEVERRHGTALLVETIHAVLAEKTPLVEIVAARMPVDPDPLHDVVFITRTGALFFPCTAHSRC